MSLPKIILPRKPNIIRLNESVNFFDLFKKIEKQFKTCFILESMDLDGNDSRYSILGFDPEKNISCDSDHLIINNEYFKVDNPYYSLREVIPTDILSMNYAGGLVGYLSYEAMNFFEPRLNLNTHSHFPLFEFGLYLDGIIYDKMTGEIFYFYYNTNRIQIIQDLINYTNISDSSYNTKIEFVKYSISKEDHSRKVFEALDEVRAGNTFQCQIGLKAEYKIQGDTFPIYTQLREVNPSPHMFYIKFNNKKIIGASPELLFRLRNGEMETFPLAGSIRRGLNTTEDVLLARTLLNDEKEIAEHNMLVDLHRNDLGRVAKFGTVKVRKLMDIKKYSHIQHISSEVIGIIHHKEDMFSGLAHSFPAGTLTGAPKFESMKIIHKLEDKNPRGPYGGGVGHFGLNGNCTFAIPIRSIFISDSYLYTQASSGIVYDSISENEYQEIKNKLGASEKVLNYFLSKKVL